jgi:transcriptional repressor NrdR
MHCAFCGAESTRVVDSRSAEGGGSVRRRRRCESCGSRFTTFERVEALVTVRKREGRLEPFDSGKVRSGLERALADRPLPPGAIDAVVRKVEAFAGSDRREIDSQDIGRIVLDALRELDEVAYLRFASVYKDFQGASDFEREMATLDE